MSTPWFCEVLDDSGPTASVWQQSTMHRPYADQRQVLPMLRGLTCVVVETQPTLECCCTEEGERLP